LPEGRRLRAADTPFLFDACPDRGHFDSDDFALMLARRILMIAGFSRPLVMGVLPVALIACMNSPSTSAESSAAVPLGIDLGGSGPVIASAQPELPATVMHAEPQAAPPQHHDMQMAHDGRKDAHGTGMVNSVDPTQRKINLSHNPIPEIGWPSMTMEFPVAPSVDLKAIKPGTRVNFTIEQQPGGMYEIRTIAPAGGDR
jgi:Cu/Ag efflux protein CusF